jgi:predicted CXXCH cytochrome family protein
MRRFDRALRALIILNLAVVALLAAGLVADWAGVLDHASPLAPGASPTPDTMRMGLAHIPTSADCTLCHTSGGSAGLKPVPALAHPIQGWTACLVCHTDDKLGREAPGHTGIAQDECLSCHKAAVDGPAITQAHAQLDAPCLSCHGSVAHLPTSMVGRSQDDCWLCHRPSTDPAPVRPHPDPAGLTCRSCHSSGNAGALPIDHALRAESTCALCHQVRPSPSPSPAG